MLYVQFIILDFSICVAPSSPGSNYGTLGRPVSMPAAKVIHHRSNSDPDLPGSNPQSPDNEVASLMGKIIFAMFLKCSFFTIASSVPTGFSESFS